MLAGALPRRTVTTLRAESLVNDGTALVIYGLAVGVTRGDDQLGVLHVGGLFLLSYAGGAVAGLLSAWVWSQVRRRLDDPLLVGVSVIVIPFAAFLLADAVHASGVLAVVSCGLAMSQITPRLGQPITRQQTQDFFWLSTFILNGALFVLVGLQLQSAVRGLSSTALSRGLITVAAVSGAVIGVRFAWLNTAPYLIRALDRHPSSVCAGSARAPGWSAASPGSAARCRSPSRSRIRRRSRPAAPSPTAPASSS